jgi:hypothetical protein
MYGENMIYTVNFRDGNSGEPSACVCMGIVDLDNSISGIEMDGGNVNFVVDDNGRKVTSSQVFSAHTEAF